nr:Hsp20/alpha crystallin family protein [Desulfobulbus sp.]
MVRANATAPAINVIETDKEYKVEVAAPGMTREDFNIRINDGNQLVVTMEKKFQSEDKDAKAEKKMTEKQTREWAEVDKAIEKSGGEGRYLRREFSYTRFQQAMILPDNIKADKISAKMEHGVLNISIPKSAPKAQAAKERLIEVK